MGAVAGAARKAKVNAVGTMKTGVPLKVRVEDEIEEIDSVSEAADFLQRWPLER
ncbi:DUF982 domain-containing protein, partial [Mesorhizobium sp. M7A.F.Ca.CA.002.09.1.1]